MTADPHEGLDADGFIVTGADPANIGPPYDAVVATVRHAVPQAPGDRPAGTGVANSANSSGSGTGQWCGR